MNFFDWTYGTKADSAIAQDVSLEEHDRRFHPKGYKEGDVCSLRDTANKEDALPIDNGSSEKAVSLLRNWLPNVKIVEDDSADSMQRALADDVRAFIQKSYYERWKNMISDFRRGAWIMTTASGTKGYNTVLPYVPDVIKNCFGAIGYKLSDFNNGSVNVSTMTVAKTTELSDEVQAKRAKGEPSRYIAGVSVSNTHGIPIKEGWEKLPLILDAPVAVFRSSTEPRGILLMCQVEDEDPIKQIEVRGERHGQYAIIAINGPEMDRLGNVSNGRVTIGSYYGRSFREFKQDLKDGLLIYVDKKRIKSVADQFGGLNLDVEAGKIQKTSEYIKDRLEKSRGYVVSLAPVKSHKVLTDEDFKFSALGTVIPDKWDYDDLRREGQFEAMRAMLNEEAKRKGYKFSTRLDAYVKIDEHHKKIIKSAELQEWDGNGYTIPLAERFNDNKSDRRYKIIRRGDEPIGWYNRTTGEVHLVKGKADAETVAHELGWHASFHSAEQNDPALYKQMMDYAKTAPSGIKEAVLATYGNDLTEEELLDEIGAKRFTEENLDVITDAMAKQEASGWFGKVKDGVKRVWSGFIARIGGNRFDSSQISTMSPEEGMRILAKAMAEGKTLTTESLGEKRTE